VTGEFFFFNLVCDATGTAATPGLLRVSTVYAEMVPKFQAATASFLCRTLNLNF
jgi:hypothetical protein